MTGKKSDEKIKKVSSATKNMSALVDDIARKARHNFKEKGTPDVDVKFLKDSVGALKELFELLGEYDETDVNRDGIVIRIEKEAEEWGG